MNPALTRIEIDFDATDGEVVAFPLPLILFIPRLLPAKKKGCHPL